MKTITEAYKLEQMRLHENPDYGIASIEFAPMVAEIINHAFPRTITDYGAGKQRLKTALDALGVSNFQYQPFDPAFPNYGEPREADLVCCIDVLEHIEPELLDNVLADLARITKNIGFFTVHMGAADKTLSDGRNAHLIQKPTSWWLPKQCQQYEIGNLQTHQVFGSGFMVVVGPIQA